MEQKELPPDNKGLILFLIGLAVMLIIAHFTVGLDHLFVFGP